MGLDFPLTLIPLQNQNAVLKNQNFFPLRFDFLAKCFEPHEYEKWGRH